jgi:hypothetical protein
MAKRDWSNGIAIIAVIVAMISAFFAWQQIQLMKQQIQSAEEQAQSQMKYQEQEIERQERSLENQRESLEIQIQSLHNQVGGLAVSNVILKDTGRIREDVGDVQTTLREIAASLKEGNSEKAKELYDRLKTQHPGNESLKEVGEIIDNATHFEIIDANTGKPLAIKPENIKPLGNGVTEVALPKGISIIVSGNAKKIVTDMGNLTNQSQREGAIGGPNERSFEPGQTIRFSGGDIEPSIMIYPKWR